MSEQIKGQLVNFAPTKPCIDRLIEVLGVPDMGEDISMADIENAINVRRNTHRWSTVIAKWKDVMRVNYGVIILCKRG